MLLAGIYICNNRSPIKLVPTLDWVDFGDDVFPYNNEKLPISLPTFILTFLILKFRPGSCRMEKRGGYPPSIKCNIYENGLVLSP